MVLRKLKQKTFVPLFCDQDIFYSLKPDFEYLKYFGLPDNFKINKFIDGCSDLLEIPDFNNIICEVITDFGSVVYLDFEMLELSKY
jgi:hypothetical protein